MNKKICQRCDQEFNCQVEDISCCQCNGINLLEETKDFLKKTKFDCLCISCLVDLNNKQEEIKELAREELIENKHYYMENGLLVFTELYHMTRGTCCKSNCRHCAFGFSLTK